MSEPLPQQPIRFVRMGDVGVSLNVTEEDAEAMKADGVSPVDVLMAAFREAAS